jgi:plasmid stability protein
MVAMANITVKNIPDELYDDVRLLAQQDRRSINAEIIELLSEVAGWRKRQTIMRESAAELDALVASVPWSDVSSVDLIREDRYGDE